MATRMSRSSAKFFLSVRIVVPGEEAEAQDGEASNAGDKDKSRL